MIPPVRREYSPSALSPYTESYVLLYAGANVEPPLTNVFTMQWFLTMFATCLPVDTVLRIWDCVMVDGSEILIRTALALWTKLAKYVGRAGSPPPPIISVLMQLISCLDESPRPNQLTSFI